jgi:hypothetical protein
VRLSAKRLRYSAGLADRLKVRRPPRALRTLRATQESLGDLHDRETLLQLVMKLPAPDDDESRETVRHFIAAEMDQLHARYVALRPQLLDVCDGCLRLAADGHPRLRLLLAAGAAVNSVLIARTVARRLQQESSDDRNVDVAEPRYRPAS